MLSVAAKILAGWGVRANGVTFAGFLVSAGAGVLAAQGMWLWAAAAAIVSGACDLLDGKIARLDISRSKFGALWDSALDRYSDAFLIAGIGYFFALQGQPLILIAAFSAMAGAFEISYVRARAEGLGFDCRVGFWERGERWVLLVTGLLFMNPVLPVLILAVAAHVTAFRRILHIRGLSLQTDGKPVTSAPITSKWSQVSNLVLAGAALLAVIFLRWPA